MSYGVLYIYIFLLSIFEIRMLMYKKTKNEKKSEKTTKWSKAKKGRKPVDEEAHIHTCMHAKTRFSENNALLHLSVKLVSE